MRIVFGLLSYIFLVAMVGCSSSSPAARTTNNNSSGDGGIEQDGTLPEEEEETPQAVVDIATRVDETTLPACEAEWWIADYHNDRSKSGVAAGPLDDLLPSSSLTFLAIESPPNKMIVEAAQAGLEGDFEAIIPFYYDSGTKGQSAFQARLLHKSSGSTDTIVARARISNVHSEPNENGIPLKDQAILTVQVGDSQQEIRSNVDDNAPLELGNLILSRSGNTIKAEVEIIREDGMHVEVEDTISGLDAGTLAISFGLANIGSVELGTRTSLTSEEGLQNVSAVDAPWAFVQAFQVTGGGGTVKSDSFECESVNMKYAGPF